MNLTYRGIRYTPPTPTLSNYTVSDQWIGTYRGVLVTMQRYECSPAAQPFMNLRYRGAFYQPIERSSSNLQRFALG